MSVMVSNGERGNGMLIHIIPWKWGRQILVDPNTATFGIIWIWIVSILQCQNPWWSIISLGYATQYIRDDHNYLIIPELWKPFLTKQIQAVFVDFFHNDIHKDP